MRNETHTQTITRLSAESDAHQKIAALADHCADSECDDKLAELALRNIAAQERRKATALTEKVSTLQEQLTPS